ncbi:creatininase family protein [Mobilitalea sibirica]|uniref:Creatininase family protein n=1 Tax=Mobilitalea sibirica TaxID=1462919 RepID=A0A8J7H993_9FIRM|nr:creatininase family protein [Mobilitalea sibirica]MBH1940910.1 creatininase family protein [Mobilitalea sibirica]
MHDGIYNEKDFIEYLNTWIFPSEQSTLIETIAYDKDIPLQYQCCCGTDGLIEANGEEYWCLESVVNKKLLGNFLDDIEFFKTRCKKLIKNIRRNQFKVLVIGTGHLSPQQINILEEFEKEFNNKEFRVIIWHSEKAIFPKELMTDDYLHAGVEETSEMLHINNSLVQLNELGEDECERKLGLDKQLRELISIDLGMKRLELEKQQLILKVQELI